MKPKFTESKQTPQFGNPSTLFLSQIRREAPLAYISLADQFLLASSLLQIESIQRAEALATEEITQTVRRPVTHMRLISDFRQSA